MLVLYFTTTKQITHDHTKQIKWTELYSIKDINSYQKGENIYNVRYYLGEAGNGERGRGRESKIRKLRNAFLKEQDNV